MTEAQLAAPQFAALTEAVLDAYLARDPVEATYLGDHRRDALLPDPSPAAAAARAAEIRAQLAELAVVEKSTVDARVDAEVLRTALAAELLDLEEIREAEWNPMLHNPGGGLHALLTRNFAPLPNRLGSAAERLTAVPDYLAAARDRLDTMSRPHLDTAINQLDGTLGILDRELPALVRDDAALSSRVEQAAEPARRALVEHRDWLAARADSATREPRLGESLFAAKLALTLDTSFAPTALLARAEEDLDRVTAQIVEQAGRLAGEPAPQPSTVHRVLDELAAQVPTDETILQLCRDALAATTAFVRDADLVTVFDDPVDIVTMPEIDRGVAVAYCRENGPLERAVLPTEFAVSPTPAGWTAQQVASFYREYNLHMLHDLTVHEAMPGHALQLMHGNRHRTDTRVRAVWRSGAFVEGWAVYAEELMARHGYPGAGSAGALRMQQLKMQLRSLLNTILDIRFHCDDLDEREALDLMTRRGFQEEGEAIGKWRRVQLSATQLCTYYVGYLEISAVADALRAARPHWSQRQVHDALLAHGCPPARHLRTLLDLRASG